MIFLVKVLDTRSTLTQGRPGKYPLVGQSHTRGSDLVSFGFDEICHMNQKFVVAIGNRRLSSFALLISIPVRRGQCFMCVLDFLFIGRMIFSKLRIYTITKEPNFQ